jgi:hypothetical protein
VVPTTEETKEIETELVAEQIVCGANGDITGRGFTIIRNVSGLPIHIIGEVVTVVI